MSTIWYEGPADGNIEGRYGLDSHEWVGSLSDRVATIIDNAPEPQVQTPSVDDGFEL